VHLIIKAFSVTYQTVTAFGRYQNTVNADMDVSVVDMTIVTEGRRFGTVYVL